MGLRVWGVGFRVWGSGFGVRVLGLGGVWDVGLGAKGVSMTGCAGAGSTQARTPICTSPPPLALHPGLDLYGFRVLSNSDRAPVLLLVLCTCPACWKLDLLGPEVLVWVWGWLEAFGFLQTVP